MDRGCRALLNWYSQSMGSCVNHIKVMDTSENCFGLAILPLPLAELAPIRLRSVLHPVLTLRTVSSRTVPLSDSSSLRPVPASLCTREDTSQTRRDSALVGCPPGKLRASLAGSQSLRAIMGDLPVPDAQAMAVLGLAPIEHPRSKENSRMKTGHPNGGQIHRNEPPHVIR